MKRFTLTLVLALIAGLLIAQVALADHQCSVECLTANPELMVYNRYVHSYATTAKMTDSAYLAANPELRTHNRYARADATTASMSDAGLLRGREADASRYVAMGEAYRASATTAGMSDSGLLRGIEADASRYAAMGEAYRTGTSTFFWAGR